MVFGRKKEAPAPPPPPPPRKTPQQQARELARQNDRTINRAQREMARERLRLEAEEKKIMSEIKAMGRKGRMVEARMLAKNLVQVRNAKARTYQASIQAGAVGSQARMAQANATMMGVVDSTRQVMANANGLNDPQKHMRMMQDFEMETEKYKLNEEMTDEVLDSVLGGSEVEGETDDVLNAVLDEIGFEVSGRMGEAPSMRPAAQQDAERLRAADDAELMSRIQRLGN